MEVFLHPTVASSKLTLINIYFKDNFGSGSRSQIISATPAPAPTPAPQHWNTHSFCTVYAWRDFYFLAWSAWKGCVEHSDHGWGEEAPGKELEEDDHEGVVEARLPQPGARHHAFHLLSLGHDQKDFNQSSTAEARVLNAMYHLVLWIWNRIQIESVFRTFLECGSVSVFRIPVLIRIQIGKYRIN